MVSLFNSYLFYRFSNKSRQVSKKPSHFFASPTLNWSEKNCFSMVFHKSQRASAWWLCCVVWWSAPVPTAKSSKTLVRKSMEMIINSPTLAAELLSILIIFIWVFTFNAVSHYQQPCNLSFEKKHWETDVDRIEDEYSNTSTWILLILIIFIIHEFLFLMLFVIPSNLKTIYLAHRTQLHAWTMLHVLVMQLGKMQTLCL